MASPNITIVFNDDAATFTFEGVDNLDHFTASSILTREGLKAQRIYEAALQMVKTGFEIDNDAKTIAPNSSPAKSPAPKENTTPAATRPLKYASKGSGTPDHNDLPVLDDFSPEPTPIRATRSTTAKATPKRPAGAAHDDVSPAKKQKATRSNTEASAAEPTEEDKKEVTGSKKQIERQRVNCLYRIHNTLTDFLEHEKETSALTARSAITQNDDLLAWCSWVNRLSVTANEKAFSEVITKPKLNACKPESKSKDSPQWLKHEKKIVALMEDLKETTRAKNIKLHSTLVKELGEGMLSPADDDEEDDQEEEEA